jgi:hypothetical protein
MTKMKRIVGLASFSAFVVTGIASAQSPASTPENYIQEFGERLAVIKEMSTLPKTAPSDRAGCIRTAHNTILRIAADAFSNPAHLAPGVTPQQYDHAMLCAAAKAQVECAKKACNADVRACTETVEFEKTANRICVAIEKR